MFIYSEQNVKLNGSQVDRTLQSALEGHLREYSLDVEGPVSLHDLTGDNPTPLCLSHPQGTQHFRAVDTEAPTLTRVLKLESTPEEPLLVLAASVHPRSAHEFRAAGIQFLDSAGNAYLKFAGVLIDVRGRRPDPSTVKDQTPSRSPGGLFTPRRAQVIFALLSWPELLDAPVRTVASAAKVSVGQAQSTLRLLDEQGFLDRHSQRLPRPEFLAEQWANAFPAGLGPKTLVRQFHGDPLRMDLAGHGVIYVSGEQAAPWINHTETATLYVQDLSPALVVENHWRADGAPNIMVHTVFWNPPDHDAQGAVSFPAPAPPLLVYADLKSTGESRQLEAAQHLKERHAHLWHP